MAKGHKTGGRRKGTLNKATAKVRALAQQYTAACIDRLAEITRDDNPTAAVAACRELLNRGHGLPAQNLHVDQEVTLLDCLTALNARDAENAATADLEEEVEPVCH